MRRIAFILSAITLALTSTTATASTSTEPQALELQVGETRVLPHPGVKRVAIGNGQVLSAVATEGRDVVIFARAEGVSSVHVWAAGA